MRVLAVLTLALTLAGSAAAQPQPQPKQSLPKRKPPVVSTQQCLAACARTYYQCQSGDDSQACSPRWMQCRAGCR